MQVEVGENGELTREGLSEVLEYLPETGQLIHARDFYCYSDVCEVGSVVTSKRHSIRYRYVRLNGKTYGVHRVVWFMFHEAWPAGVVDHIDGDGLNNRIENLRDVSHRENISNTKRRREGEARYPGVSYDEKRKKRKWGAKIWVEGRTVQLGHYLTEEEAIMARKVGEVKYLGAVVNLIG